MGGVCREKGMREKKLILEKVQDVQLDRGQETVVGTLHLTVHHLIFRYTDEKETEVWVKMKPSFFFFDPVLTKKDGNRYLTLLYTL